MGIQQDAPGNLDLLAKLFLWYGLDWPYAQVCEDYRSWGLVESLKNLSTLGKKACGQIELPERSPGIYDQIHLPATVF